MKEKLTFLELSLNNSRPKAAGLIRSLPRPYTEFELLWLLKRAAEDKKLRGLVLNTSGFSAGRAFIWELRTALEMFKESGKKIIAYFDNADFDLYAMVSAADRIVMDRGGTISLMGYSIGRLYVKETLDKLGIGFRELRCLDYKTANEMFSRVSMSAADREQYGAYLDEIFGFTKDAIIKGRGLDEDRFNSILNGDFVLSPRSALEKGLVDAAGREEAIEKAIRETEAENGENKASGGTHAKTRREGETSGPEIRYKVWGVSSILTRGHNVSYYDAPRSRGRGAEIALVTAKGNTDMEQGISARYLSRVIFEAAEKSRVKAVVIRIESPGGSAVAADYIAQAVREVKKDKPVVVSLGEVAASGGYWAAMYGSHVTASPYTLTGSIGVIAGWFFNKGLNGKTGLNVEALSRGDHADLLSGFIIPSRDLSPEEDAQFRRCIMELYGDFISKAAEGRNMKEDEIEPLARGRIYSGSAAHNFKLVDSLGGYLAAIENARHLAGIPENKRIIVREYPKPKFYEALAARFFSSFSSLAAVAGIGEAAAVMGLGGLSRGEDIYRLRRELLYRLSQNGRAMPVLPLGILS